MSLGEAFAEFVTAHEPLAPYTHLRIGGPAEYLAQPRTLEELTALLKIAKERKLALKVLGNGCNILIRDEGVAGIVLRLSAPTFTQVVVEGKQVRAGSGAALSALISMAAQHNLAGLETLVGIPGTIGGALRCNAGDRSGEIGQFVQRIQLLDPTGQIVHRERTDVQFREHGCSLDEGVILAVEFEFEPDAAERIVKRMRRAWIQRKALQPFSFQAAVRVFKNPRGQQATALLERTGLAKTKVGGVEVSERNCNYLVANAGSTARDVLRLINLMQSRVRESCGIELEPELLIW